MYTSHNLWYRVKAMTSLINPTAKKASIPDHFSTFDPLRGIYLKNVTLSTCHGPW